MGYSSVSKLLVLQSPYVFALYYNIYFFILFFQLFFHKGISILRNHWHVTINLDSHMHDYLMITMLISTYNRDVTNI